HAADRPPVQAAEVNDQIGRDIADGAVDFLRTEDQCAHWAASVIRGRFQSRLHLVTKLLIVRLFDRAIRLAAFDIEEDARVVAAFAPDLRARPVDAELGEGR